VGDPVLLVTGSREWPTTLAGRDAVRRALITACYRITDSPRGAVRVRHGCARGLDTLVDQVALQLGLPRHKMPAKWRDPCPPTCPANHRLSSKGFGGTYCPDAGHRRNDDMIATRPIPREVLSFPINPWPSGGTWRCTAAALLADLPVYLVGPDGSMSRLEASPDALAALAIPGEYRTLRLVASGDGTRLLEKIPA
jgi:hypothetical protein